MLIDRERANMFVRNVYMNFKRYIFLLIELVKRDFKIKYKRSVLGILWSVLNPLFMMLVMNVVFSHFFRFQIEGMNFLVYLISGLVMFNFFSEASNTAMASIVNNFSLMNKVYIPKYIFPLARCVFVFINFLLTLIPMYLIILFTGTEETRAVITWVHIALPYVFICLFFFTLGVGLILATVSVFLRDMFYIWTIVITILNYVTPIFWPMSLVEDSSMTTANILRLNPLYQFIQFARTIILEARMPDLQSFIICGAWAIGLFIAGGIIFRAKQDKFIYHV